MQKTFNDPLRLAAATRCVAGAVVALCLTASSTLSAAGVDLASAVVVTPPGASGRQATAVRMLIEEVEKRTQIQWKSGERWPESGVPVIVVGPSSFVEPTLQQHGVRDLQARGFSTTAPEGYRLRVFDGKPAVVVVAGNDARGVLFGVGRLLRALRMSPRQAVVAAELNIATAPKYPLRGHQLGYRPKTNSYDAWSVPMWEQYIRDLAVFGTNAVELLPPRSDDAANSPHFPLPPMRMMIEMSRLLDEYGLDVWIWYPAMDPDYSNPATVQSALKEWAEVFRQLPRVDAVFVPGGDPGHTDPAILMPFLEQQTANLHRYHPKAQMWVSPQSFNQKWLETFLSNLKNQQPDWLAGVVYGPQVRISLPELRAAVPMKYPIRRYPDITHCRQCQYPVPEWDVAYAVTEGREVINPRPQDEAHIFRALQQYANGFISYSEGCNDDVNKIVWSGLGWDPKTPVIDILREYARYFLVDIDPDDFAEGLMSLERNWRGALLANPAVVTTLQQFQAMEKNASPRLSQNWRFQQALYRAYYDAFIHNRLVYETGLEQLARTQLDSAGRNGSQQAMNLAEQILDRSITHPAAPEWRARVFELGDMLFQSIRMQLSVARHRAIAPDRGATLDTIDVPLNNRLWLKRVFADIRGRSSESERLREIRTIVHWADPGPGGFYDDLGNVLRQPHLLNMGGFLADPGSFTAPRFGYVIGRPYFSAFPLSWWDNVESMYDAPLKMQYSDLDSTAPYFVRISYAGDAPSTKIRLLADDKYEVHPEIAKPRPAALVEYDIPLEATRDGRLTLTWYREPGKGGNGRGCAVAEIWLIKRKR